MSWKESFPTAVALFRENKYDDALKVLNKVLKLGGDTQYVVYDTRAAVYERLERTKDAIVDSKKVVELAPGRWHGYYRLARLLFRIGKAQESLIMTGHALRFLKADNTVKRDEMGKIKADAQAYIKFTTNFIANLPVELLSEIFAIVLQSNHNQLQRICRVCSQWRNIAINTPSLWSKLALHAKDPIGKARAYMLNSKGRIRELYLRGTLGQNIAWKVETLKSLKWRHLEVLFVEHFDINPIIASMTAEGLPCLSRIHLIEKRTSEVRMAQVLSHLEGADVRHLVLEGVRASSVFDNIPDEHCNLISFTLCDSHIGANITKLVDLLSRNPMLESLIIDRMPDFRGTISTSISMEHLTHLELVQFNAMRSLFQHVSFPNLSSLILGKEGQSIDSIFVRLLETNTFNLKQLSIDYCAVSVDRLVELLAHSSLLEDLALRRIPNNITNRVIERINSSHPHKPPSTQPPSSLPIPNDSVGFSPMCPRLRNLDVSNCPDVRTGPLHRLVKARLADDEHPTDSLVLPLETLRIDGCQRIEVETLPWFRARVPTFSCVYMSKKEAKWKR